MVARIHGEKKTIHNVVYVLPDNNHFQMFNMFQTLSLLPYMDYLICLSNQPFKDSTSIISIL